MLSRFIGKAKEMYVLGRHRGVRGEGIKSQKCASVPAYQRTSSFLKYIRVRARVYLWKLPVRWYTGTLCLPILTLVKGAQGWRAEVPHKDFVGNVIT